MLNGNLQKITEPIAKYYTYGSAPILCPYASYGSGTELNPSLTLGTAADSKRWTKWTVDGIYGTDLVPDVCDGTTVDADDSYSYQKAENYTGYENLYLFANYEN